MKWLDEQLAYAKAKCATHILVFQHIPLFLRAVDEAKEYFNLDSAIRMTLLEKFAAAGK